MRLLAPIAAAILLCAAAPQPELAGSLEALTAKDLRVATLAYRLQTGAVALCPEHTALPGFVVQHASQYRADLRPTAEALYDFGGGAAVVAVVPGSAAERAGLRVRDRILEVGGVTVGSGSAGRRADQDDVTELLALIDRSFAAGPARFSLLRAGRPLAIDVAGAPGCASTIQLELGGGVNAGADGRIVTVSQRMADESPDDGLA